MAANGPSKADLEDMVDRALEVLDDAYDPAVTRETLANAVGSALDILRGEDEDEEELDEEEDDED